jgi:hypothetical protein
MKKDSTMKVYELHTRYRPGLLQDASSRLRRDGYELVRAQLRTRGNQEYVEVKLTARPLVSDPMAETVQARPCEVCAGSGIHVLS